MKVVTFIFFSLVVQRKVQKLYKEAIISSYLIGKFAQLDFYAKKGLPLCTADAQYCIQLNYSNVMLLNLSLFKRFRHSYKIKANLLGRKEVT